MGNKTNNGGPAFPVRYRGEQRNNEHIVYTDKGMSLRDYFAAKAMQGLVSEGSYLDMSITANTAYKIADAMLEAREK